MGSLSPPPPPPFALHPAVSPAQLPETSLIPRNRFRRIQWIVVGGRIKESLLHKATPSSSPSQILLVAALWIWIGGGGGGSLFPILT